MPDKNLRAVIRLVKESSLVQPCPQGISAGSFPEQRLVIEPRHESMFQNGRCEGLGVGAVIKSKSDIIFIVRKQFYYM